MSDSRWGHRIGVVMMQQAATCQALLDGADLFMPLHAIDTASLASQGVTLRCLGSSMPGRHIVPRWALPEADLLICSTGSGPSRPGSMNLVRTALRRGDEVELHWLKPSSSGVVAASRKTRVTDLVQVQRYRYALPSGASETIDHARFVVLEDVVRPGMSGAVVTCRRSNALVGFVHGNGPTALVLDPAPDSRFSRLRGSGTSSIGLSCLCEHEHPIADHVHEGPGPEASARRSQHTGAHSQ